MMKDEVITSAKTGAVSGTSENSKIIKASTEDLYQAFIDSTSLAAWLAPGDIPEK